MNLLRQNSIKMYKEVKLENNMRRYLLKFSYIGTSYRGSQKMSNNYVLDIDSVQGAIESSLHLMTPMFENKINLIMAGRTDAGVHAMCSAGHIDLKLKSESSIDNNQMISSMNRNLIKCGHEIRVFSFNEVSNDFHARFSAKSRTYLYRILLSKNSDNHQIPILEHNRALHIHSKNFNIEKMKNGIKLFQGIKNFKTFSTVKEHQNENMDSPIFVRELKITLEQAEPLMSYDLQSKNFIYWNIIFTSKSFLYNQIRRIVGALIALGYNTVNEDHITHMLQVPSYSSWDPRLRMASPHGLYLVNVEYDNFLDQEISS